MNFLIVDQFDVVCKVVKCILIGMNFEVMEVCNVVDVIVCCMKLLLQIVIVEVVMDGVLEFIQFICFVFGNECICIYYCIVEVDFCKMMVGCCVGVNDFLMKFFDCKMLGVVFNGFVQLVEQLCQMVVQ